MEKRGISTQPFIYIFSTIIVAFIAIFGFKTVRDLNNNAEFVSLTKFVNDLEEQVERYSKFDVGSEKRLRISLPNKVTEVCFVNNDNEINQDIDQDLKEMMEINEKDNMYVLPLFKFPAPAPDFRIENLDINPEINPLCFETKGFLNAVIETKVKDNEIYVELRK